MSIPQGNVSLGYSVQVSIFVREAQKSSSISVLRVASGPRVKLASCKSALTSPAPTPPSGVVYSADRSKAVVPVLVLLFVALWFILRGDLLYVLPCVILFLCFSVLLVLLFPRLGKTELILVLFVRLFDLCLFGFVGFLFLLVSGKGLQFVIVALPGLFFYLFFNMSGIHSQLCNQCWREPVHY